MTTVAAVEEIFETDFAATGDIHFHAFAGEVGTVQVTDGEWLTVTWHRTGTTTDVHQDEVFAFQARR